MPPAFNLSQDQTLEFNHCYYFICFSFLKRRAQNYRLVIFRSYSLLHHSIRLFKHLIFYELKLFKTRCSRLSVRYCVFKERRCGSNEDMNITDAFLKCQIFLKVFFIHPEKSNITATEPD